MQPGFPKKPTLKFLGTKKRKTTERDRYFDSKAKDLTDPLVRESRYALAVVLQSLRFLSDEPEAEMGAHDRAELLEGIIDLVDRVKYNVDGIDGLLDGAHRGVLLEHPPYGSAQMFRQRAARDEATE